MSAPPTPHRPTWDGMKAYRDGTTEPLLGPGQTAGERDYVRKLRGKLEHAEKQMEQLRERARELRSELRELGVEA